MDSSLNEVLEKIKESSGLQEAPFHFPSNKISDLNQTMNGSKAYFWEKRNQKAKMKNIDKIVNDICTGGELSNGLQSLK